MGTPPLPEAVLQYAWQTLRYLPNSLTTLDGDAVQVLHPGFKNLHQGPDFTAAHVRVGRLEWMGAVELHPVSNDWYTHGHHQDPAYNTTVLHVVYSSSGKPIMRQDGSLVPEVSLAGLLPEEFLQAADRLLSAQDNVPCQGLATGLHSFAVQRWLQTVGAERVVAKAEKMESYWKEKDYRWAELLWHELAGAWAGPINKAAFQELTSRLPLRLLQRYADKLIVLEALLLGTAGLLPTPAEATDAYTAELQAHWLHYQRLHSLSVLPAGSLRYLRMRPSNFPPLRLAQLAALVHASPQLLTLLELTGRELLRQLQVKPSSYWETHYKLGAAVSKAQHRPGQAFCYTIIINALAPFALLYQRQKGNQQALQQCLEWLQALPPEQNNVVRSYDFLPLGPRDALESQGLLQLRAHYCTPRRCLACGIGHQLLKAKGRSAS